MKMWMPRAIGGLRARSGGFALMEVVVAMSLLGVFAGLMGNTVFQALSFQRTGQANLLATQELRRAGDWFSVDAASSETTSLIDGNPAASSTTLGWTDTGGTPHTATYNLSGDNLMRDFDGVQTAVARRVVSVGFSLTGSVLAFDLEVQAAQGSTRSQSLQTYLMVLQ